MSSSQSAEGAVPMAADSVSQQDINAELYAAVTDCSDRCLPFAAKWASELLVELSLDLTRSYRPSDVADAHSVGGKQSSSSAMSEIDENASATAGNTGSGQLLNSAHPLNLLEMSGISDKPLATSQGADGALPRPVFSSPTDRGSAVGSSSFAMAGPMSPDQSAHNLFGTDSPVVFASPQAQRLPPAATLAVSVAPRPELAGSASSMAAAGTETGMGAIAAGGIGARGRASRQDISFGGRSVVSLTSAGGDGLSLISSAPGPDGAAGAAGAGAGTAGPAGAASAAAAGGAVKSRSLFLQASSALSPQSTFRPTQRPAVDERALLAKALFELREYERASWVLRDLPTEADSDAAIRQMGRVSRPPSSPLVLFLRGYLTYLTGERRKEEEMAEKVDPLLKAKVVNRELVGLAKELDALFAEGFLDAFCLYLYGLVLKGLDRGNEAIAVLVQSVNEYPCNWSAWQLLSSLVTSKEQMLSLPLKPHWITRFFFVDALLELPHSDAQISDTFQLLASLMDDFPKSSFVLSQMAQAHFNKRDYDQAQALFEELRTLDPHRLEGMDTYSNILFVSGQRPALSFLAHAATKIDRYRPQTCCIIGNYYSLKSDHARAVEYYWRALQLDPSYASAWTLMGHENIELRNASAAIQCYRRALHLNGKDFRAWYGLGQAYEIMQMWSFALYYFRRAVTFRPYDPRMWCAVAECYERLSRPKDALTCYLRAEANEDRERIAAIKAARLYAAQGDVGQACVFFKRALERRPEVEHTTDADLIDARLFLSRQSLLAGKYQQAEEYVSILLETGGQIKDQARDLLTEIRQAASAAAASNAAGAAHSSRGAPPRGLAASAMTADGDEVLEQQHQQALPPQAAPRATTFAGARAAARTQQAHGS